MCRLALFPLLLLLGGGCLPEAREAAVRVEVTYGFKAGCITVIARDAEAPEREASEQLEVLPRGPSTVRLAVFRQEGWSHTLELTTTAHEQSCAGPVVAREVRTLPLRKAGIEQLAVTLEAPDEDGDGYMPTASGGTDCQDKDGAIHPGATEVCDDRDNDCDGSTDEETGPLWYPDRDGDGFGDRSASPLVGCTAPASPPAYVQEGSDCADSDAAIFPRSGFSETRCDDVDDDCDGVVDDGFDIKGAPCSDPCPGGQYVCNASRNGLACSAPQHSLFPDVDGDGAGDESSPSVGAVCPGVTPPVGTVANASDCDDLDPHNWRGNAEVCDDRDNTCDSQRDEGDVCGGKGWKVLEDPALTGSRQWKTVALGANGRVWIAGAGGALAIRTAAGQPFTSLDGSCGTYNWRAAWVRPSDGAVFLAGGGGRLAQHDGNTCSNQTGNAASTRPFTGIIGFDPAVTSTIYVVNDVGRLSTWTPGTAPVEQYNQDPETYFGIHGLEPTLLLGVGGTENTPSVPYIDSYPGTGSSVQAHTLQDTPLDYGGSLRAVWMGSPRLAYAVGDNGLVMKWNGETTWTRVLPPADNTTADFTSVVVLDPSSIYTTDTSGTLRRLSATGWAAHPTHTADQPLRDIALSSPSDIWAVGDDGRVLHFPE